MTQLHEDIFKIAIDEASNGMLLATQAGDIVLINKKAARMFGISQSTPPSIIELIPPSVWHEKKCGAHPFLVTANRPDGSTFKAEINISKEHAFNDVPSVHVITVSDMTYDYCREELLETLRPTDELTGLPSKSIFTDRATQALTFSQRNNRCFAMLCVDIDRFSEINNFMGASTGDDVLKKVGSRLRSSIRETDSVSRFSSDKFMCLLRDIESPQSAIDITERILQSCFSTIIRPDRPPIALSGSIGIAIYPHDGHTINHLMKNAEMAMHAVKESGKNGYLLHTPVLTQDTQKEFPPEKTMEQMLRNAIRHKEFSVHYQPQYDFGSNLIGAEALIRWKRGTKNISPLDFIPTAEESGLIVPIGEWVLYEACRQGARWAQAGHPLKIGVNLSGRQLTPALPDLVKRALDDTGFPSTLLELEVTETHLMGNMSESISILEDIRDTGVQLSIDDFGTGYSSLAHLKKLPVDTIKVAREFVRDMMIDEDSQTIVSTIIAMARQLRLKTIAEGIEDNEQCVALNEIGCNSYQGFLFGRPTDPDSFMKQFLQPGIPLANVA